MRRFFALFVTVGIVLSSYAAWCDGVKETDISGSPLLVLLAADDEEAIKIERQLVGELRLTLDGVQVEQIAIERADFLSLPLPDQLEVVEPLIRRFLARAALWVVTGGRSGHLIQFVVSDRGNSTVRTVDAGSPEELALAVRELLDSAYLFNKKKSEKERVGRKYLFALGSTLSISGGMAGHDGSSVTGGAGLQGRFMLGEGAIVGLQIAGKLGPRQLVDGAGMALGWRAEMGILAGYMFHIGKFAVGPFGEALALKNTFNSILNDGDYESLDKWSFRGALGLEVSLRLSSQLTIFIDWTVGGISPRFTFVRQSDSTDVVYTTPLVDYAFTLGLATSLL